jgi:hypothetical protein
MSCCSTDFEGKTKFKAKKLTSSWLVGNIIGSRLHVLNQKCKYLRKDIDIDFMKKMEVMF